VSADDRYGKRNDRYTHGLRLRVLESSRIELQPDLLESLKRLLEVRRVLEILDTFKDSGPERLERFDARRSVRSRYRCAKKAGDLFEALGGTGDDVEGVAFFGFGFAGEQGEDGVVEHSRLGKRKKCTCQVLRLPRCEKRRVRTALS
jgi:hypothetical protein